MVEVADQVRSHPSHIGTLSSLAKVFGLSDLTPEQIKHAANRAGLSLPLVEEDFLIISGQDLAILILAARLFRQGQGMTPQVVEAVRQRLTQVGIINPSSWRRTR